MLKFYSSLLDYIFYKSCYLCKSKAKKALLCEKCLQNLKNTGFRRTRRIRGIEIEGYFSYKDEIKKLIRAIKYHDKSELAEDIAEILYELLQNKEFTGDNIEIVPVPLHPKRQKARNYNHMEAIAHALSKLTGSKTNIDLVKRVKDTKPQYKLTQKERRQNLKEAFTINTDYYSGKQIILLDDISTTGVTMEEIINELRKNNINNVTGLVIAFPRNF